jgi:peptide deformylase
MVRQIVKYGSQVLRQPCAPVTQIDPAVKALVRDLFDSMKAAEGVGLAAPQLGILRRVVVVDVSRQHPEVLPISLINPRIVAAEGREVEEEGCLSFPDLYGQVPRHAKVRVEALDINGKQFSIETEGFYARALQHELDHLDGKLFIDYLSPLKRQLMRGRLKTLKKEGERWDQEHPQP